MLFSERAAQGRDDEIQGLLRHAGRRQDTRAPTRSRRRIASSRASITPTCRRKRTRKRSFRTCPKPTRRSRIPRSAPRTTSSEATSRVRISARRRAGSSSSAVAISRSTSSISPTSSRASAGGARQPRLPRRARTPRHADPRRGLRSHGADHARAGLPRHGGRARPSDARIRRTRVGCAACRTTSARAYPKGVADGERLRLAGKGGKGLNGGRERRPLSQREARAAPALPRVRPGLVYGPAARAVGSRARRDGGNPHAGRRRAPESQAEDAGRASNCGSRSADCRSPRTKAIFTRSCRS